MKELANIYYIFYEPIFLAVRLFLILFFVAGSVVFYLRGDLYNYFVAAASTLLIIELFVHFKIARSKPFLLVSNNKQDPLNSFTIEALAAYNNLNSRSFLNALFKHKEVKFFLSKSNINSREVGPSPFEKVDLARKALELSLNAGGLYINSADIMAAYLLMTSDKLLIDKDLNEKDLIKILEWERLHFPQFHRREHLIGRGVADEWVFGWISETKQCMLDLTNTVLNKKKFFYPREEEYKGLLSYLSNGKSVVLLGEPGSGKEALVHELVKDSYEGNLPGPLKNTRVYQFLVDQFLAGKTTQGDLQLRFVNLMEELSHQKEMIVFIEDLESILGSRDFNLDLSSALIPYIRDSHIRIIGSITPGAYKEYVSKRPSFIDSVVTIKMDRPSMSEAMSILFEKSFELEERYGVIITYQAIKGSIDLGSKYSPDISLPGNAVNLLDDASSSTNSIDKTIDLETLEEKVEEKTHIKVSRPKSEEAKKLLNLEEEIHKSIIGQNEAVTGVSEAMRRIRAGLKTSQKPVSFLFLGPTGVGKTETAKVLSRIYFGGEREIIRVDMSEFSDESSLAKMLANDSGSFIDRVFNNPFCLILLDEFEKANPKVHNLFLQILDDGRITDSENKTIAFQNALIIATSNAGSEFIRENVPSSNALPKDFSKKLVDNLLRQGIFRPELLNRFDEVIVFKPLSTDEIIQVTSLIIVELKKSLESQEIFAAIDPSVGQKVAKEGFDPEFGARPLKRFVQDFIEDPLARKILRGEIKKGEKISISVSDLGDLQIIPH